MAQVYKNLPTSSKDTIKDTTVTAATSPSVNPTEKLTPLEKLTQARINLTQEPGITKLEESIALLKLIPSEAIEFKEAAKLQKKAETQLTQQKTTLAIVGGQPLSSAWDNEVYCVDRYLKQVLNDYDNAEYLSWKESNLIRSNGQLYWEVRLRLRATNAFGGKIIKEPTFYIRPLSA